MSFEQSDKVGGVVIGFGEYIKGLRLEKEKVDPKFSLRGWCKMIGLSPSYMSGVENDVSAPPAPKHLRLMATLLEEDYEYMLSRAGRVTDEMMEILVEHPSVRKLVKVAATNPDSAKVLLVEIAEAIRDDPRAEGWLLKVVEGIRSGNAGNRAIRI